MKSNPSTDNPIHLAGPGADLLSSNSNASAGLILLGTVHSDPRGFARTRAFLENHRSDLILIEISPFALQFRKERSSELRKLFIRNVRTLCKKLAIEPRAIRKHAQIASIFRQIGIPFEYRAAASYAKREGVDLIAVDDSGFSRQWIATWPEMIAAENIEQLFKLESSVPPVASLYARAATKIGGVQFYPGTLPGGDALIWQRREKYMAAQITSALERLKPARPVYIGGWWHLTSGGSIRTLRELLGIGNDSCLLLDRTGTARTR